MLAGVTANSRTEPRNTNSKHAKCMDHVSQTHGRAERARTEEALLVYYDFTRRPPLGIETVVARLSSLLCSSSSYRDLLTVCQFLVVLVVSI